jgi:anti-repressor protein
MNELIKITGDKVDGRDLYEFLQVETPFKKWIDRMLEYGFVEGVDFWTSLSESTGGRPATEYELTINMAKEISMIQRSERGKQARLYFLECERLAKAVKATTTPSYQIEDSIERAKAWIAEEEERRKLLTTTKKQEQIIGELKPKADYTDTILQNKQTVPITKIAKDYGMSGQAMNKLLHELKIIYKLDGQWLLYADHQGKGYTHSKTDHYRDRYGDIAGVYMNTEWTQKGRLFLYEVLKKNGVLPMIERNEDNNHAETD